jgi:hypothetical protein
VKTRLISRKESVAADCQVKVIRENKKIKQNITK